jgi:hypothetical protein
MMVLPAFAGQECSAVYGTKTNAFSLATGSPAEPGLIEAVAGVFNPKTTQTFAEKGRWMKGLRLTRCQWLDC